MATQKLKELGFGEEALGHNAIAAGFQGQRQWTDLISPMAILWKPCSIPPFDWNGIREPFVMATENDALNGVAMLFGHLPHQPQHRFFPMSVPTGVQKPLNGVTGKELTGLAKNGIIHLINSGSTTLDGTGQQSDAAGNPVMKPFWEITAEEAQKCLDNTTWYPAEQGYFRGGGFSSQFITRGQMPVTMSRVNLVKGLGPVLQIAEGWTVEIAQRPARHSGPTHQPDLADHVVRGRV